MPNTDSFQKVPDFFSSKEEGKSALRENTNPRYKFFRQVHFTAGDYEQFLEFWDASSHQQEIEVLSEESIFPSQLQSSLYQNISTDDVFGTFEYIFHKFKKGIFVKFVNNELKVFLPFSKIDYTNEWSDKIFTDPKYKSPEDLFRNVSDLSGYPFDPKKVHFLKDHWYANNGLLRYEFPISENDSGVSTLRDMLLCLAKERQIPDIEFFLNKRDFPILKQNHTEPYDAIYGNNQPLRSFDRKTFCPILGMTTTDQHADIPMPTWEDWARAEFPQKVFGKEFASFTDPYIPFEDKILPTAVFRGSSTGLGTSLESNPRLYFSWLSKKQVRDTDGHLFLDCGITKWNCRPRRSLASQPYSTFDKDLVEGLGTVSFLSMKEQSQYKYILHLPGHSESYRLAYEMATGSVILMYPCPYRLWFSHLLTPYVHYVPVDKNIYETIHWCKENEEICATISKNARLFYENQLSRNGILDYMKNLLGLLQKKTGKLRFPTKNMLMFQHYIQEQSLKQEIYRMKHFPSLSISSDLDTTNLHPKTFQILLFQMDPTFLQQKMESAPVFKESRNVILKKLVLMGRTLCIKTPKKKDHSLQHEWFVSQVGTNRLANVCPMVVYIYGKFGENLVMDFVEGETLEQSLKTESTSTVLELFLQIYLQLQILLSFLQNEMGFIHFDLYPWNVILKKNVEKHTFCFPLQNGTSIRFCPPVYPVLIDFGKSHMVYENKHIVNVSPFRLHYYQDVLSLLISGVYLILHHHKISFEDSAKIMKIFQHISPSSYTNQKPFKNLSELKQFIRIKKKFSNMLLDEKREFQKKQPHHMFFYILQQKITTLKYSQNLPDIKKSFLPLEMEIYYSKYFILKECLMGENLSWTSFEKERLSTKHSSPYLQLYNDILNFHLMKWVFPSKDISVLEKSISDQCTSLLPLLKPLKGKVPFHASLPRFYSHPNLQMLDHLDTKIEKSFISKHRIFTILCIGTQNIFPRLSQKINETASSYLFSPFLEFESHSIQSHLNQFTEWLTDKN